MNIMVNTPEVIMVIHQSYLKLWPHGICVYDMPSPVLPVHWMTSMFLACHRYSTTCITGLHQILRFIVHRTSYMYGYYFVDRIYPELYVFVKELSCPNDQKRLKLRELRKIWGKMLNERWDLLQNVGTYWNTL